MTILTGEQLNHIPVTRQERYPLRQLREYLRTGQGVCVLQGPGLTGKTELLWQAARHVPDDPGAAPGEVACFIGDRGDSFDDLCIELEERPELRYVFLHRVEYFAHILRCGDYLRDYAGGGKRKIVLTGNSPLALRLLTVYTLENRCEVIHVPYLTDYEHCRFVRRQLQPDAASLSEYLSHGGLSRVVPNPEDYLRDCWAEPIAELYETQMESDVFVWLRPVEYEDTDWMSYLTAILRMASGNTPTGRETVAREFQDYFACPERRMERRRTETTALLELLLRFGVLLEWREGSRMRCAPGAPFLYHYYAVKDEGLGRRLLEAVLRRECPDAPIPELLRADDPDHIAALLFRQGEKAYGNDGLIEDDPR